MSHQRTSVVQRPQRLHLVANKPGAISQWSLRSTFQPTLAESPMLLPFTKTHRRGVLARTSSPCLHRPYNPPKAASWIHWPLLDHRPHGRSWTLFFPTPAEALPTTRARVKRSTAPSKSIAPACTNAAPTLSLTWCTSSHVNDPRLRASLHWQNRGQRSPSSHPTRLRGRCLQRVTPVLPTSRDPRHTRRQRRHNLTCNCESLVLFPPSQCDSREHPNR